MDKTTLDEVLGVIIGRAPAMRAAGILSASVEGIQFTLRPTDPAPSEGGNTEAVERPPSLLHDPWTHGQPTPDTPAVMPVRRRGV